MPAAASVAAVPAAAAPQELPSGLPLSKEPPPDDPLTTESLAARQEVAEAAEVIEVAEVAKVGETTEAAPGAAEEVVRALTPKAASAPAPAAVAVAEMSSAPAPMVDTPRFGIGTANGVPPPPMSTPPPTPPVGAQPQWGPEHPHPSSLQPSGLHHMKAPPRATPMKAFPRGASKDTPPSGLHTVALTPAAKATRPDEALPKSGFDGGHSDLHVHVHVHVVMHAHAHVVWRDYSYFYGEVYSM